MNYLIDDTITEPEKETEQEAEARRARLYDKWDRMHHDETGHWDND